MRKIFLFFAAMLVALTASATTWNITNSDEGNLRRCLRDNVNAGDTVVLADGVYAEDQSYNIRKAVVIMAADGAKPVINQKSYLNLYASAKIIGIKFKYVGTADGYCIYFRENSEKYLALEGCEFQDFTNYAFTSWDNFHIDSCIVNNCYFHDFAKGAFYFPKSTLANDTNACDKLKVTNSTFANITLNGVAVLDLRNNNNSTAATSELTVDRCTFYNCKGYERMIQTYKTPKGKVTNCIMMNPLNGEEVYDTYATYLYGGEVSNCMAYQTKGHRDWDTHPTITDCSVANPLFVDAANGDFTLGATSPALAAGTDGSNLGDPRWWPAAPATPNFYIAGIGGWNPDQVAVTGSSYTFENLAAGDYQFKITRNGTWSGENNVYGYDALTAKIGGLYRWNGGESDNNIMFTLADAGDVIVTYIEGEKFTVEGDFTIWPVELAGSWDSEWKDKRTFVPAADKMTASVTLNFTNDYYEFKVIDNGTWKGKWINNNDDKYYLTRSVLSVNSLEEGKNNIVITPDVAGDYKFTWTYGTGELTVEYPALPNPVYYLAGSMFTDGDWSQALVAMTETDGVWSKTVNFESTDSKELKVVRSVEGIHVISQDWLGLAEAQTITATTSDLVIGTGDANIGITPSKAGAYVFAFDPDGNKLSVTYPISTALDNTAVADKAQKFMENGQLFIRRDGKIYTTTGVQVK